MLDRQRFPFMDTASIASRPSIAIATGVPAVNPSVDVETNWVASGLHAGLLQQVLQRRPDPAGVAEVAAADLVRDARERDVPLDQGTRESAARSSSVISRSTMPCTVRVHASAATEGTKSAVSTR